jgi:uncharacterized protein (TIGR03083 family)
MQLTPTYGEAVLVAEPLLADPATPLLRQRHRLAHLLADLDAEQWATPSRCEGWSVQDVIAHLVTTNQFWAFSIGAGLGGEPTSFLATFDPVASPAQMVEAARATSAADTLAQFVDTNASLAAVIATIDAAGWAALGEAPPGHIALALVAQHALWDSWVHERDIVVPLGLEPVVEPDEIAACLGYAAALSPSFGLSLGSDRRGAIEIRATDPDLRYVVDIGSRVVLHDGLAPDDPIVITGDAVDLLEAFSFRRPFPTPLADEDRWIIGGLAQVFDTTV